MAGPSSSLHAWLLAVDAFAMQVAMAILPLSQLVASMQHGLCFVSQGRMLVTSESAQTVFRALRNPLRPE